MDVVVRPEPEPSTLDRLVLWALEHARQHPDVASASASRRGRHLMLRVAAWGDADFEQLRAQLRFLAEREAVSVVVVEFQRRAVRALERAVIVDGYLIHQLECGHALAGTVDSSGRLPRARVCHECSERLTEEALRQRGRNRQAISRARAGGATA